METEEPDFAKAGIVQLFVFCDGQVGQHLQEGFGEQANAFAADGSVGVEDFDLRKAATGRTAFQDAAGDACALQTLHEAAAVGGHIRGQVAAGFGHCETLFLGGVAVVARAIVIRGFELNFRSGRAKAEFDLGTNGQPLE